MSKRKAGKFVIQGKRVYLAHPTMRDGDEFIAASKRSRNLYRGVGSPADDTRSYSQYVTRSKRDDRECFLIRHREDDALVGTINLGDIVLFDLRCAMVGYNAFVPYTGCGYMTEAMQLLLKYSFRTLKLHRIEAEIQPHNTRSISLIKRCGFEFEGVSRRLVKIGGRWRDHERWSLLKEDWQSHKKVTLHKC